MWRAEPLLALLVYVGLAAAQIAWVRLVPGAVPAHNTVISARGYDAKYGSYVDLLIYGLFTMRIWLGGGISWALSVAWKLGLIAWSGELVWQSPSAGDAVLLLLALAGTAPLFADAVLTRADYRQRRRPARRTAAASGPVPLS